MKIVYSAPLPIPSLSANSVHIMKMCQALARCNHEVILYCPLSNQMPKNVEEVFQQYNVKKIFSFRPIKKCGGRFGRILYGLNTALKARKEAPDLLFARCLMSAWFGALLGIPVVYEKHNSIKKKELLTRVIFTFLIKNKNFKKLIVISEALKQHTAQDFHIPLDKIIVAHDGADPLPEINECAPFNKTSGKLHAGYVGHLYEGRGIDIIAEVAKSLTDIEFHVVGGTPEDIKHWANKLAELPNIHFYGHVPHSKTVLFLKNFDVLLAPYQRKVTGLGNVGDTVQWMSPLKIFEYMSTSLPIICSDIPVLHEVLEHKRNAFLCEPDNPDKWIETILYIIANPEEAKKVGQKGHSEFISHYTWQKRAEYIIALL